MSEVMDKVAMDRYHVPRLVEDFSIVPYNDKAFTLSIEAEERPINLNIDNYTKSLLDQIDGTRNIEQVTKEFNTNNSIQLTVDDTLEIFNERISGFGILAGDDTERIKIKDEYLRLRIKIFPTSVVKVIATKLSFLYSEKFFIYAFLGVFSFLMLNFYFIEFGHYTADLDGSFFTLMMVANILGVVIHEFGHAAACLKFGARNGPIGFGFYLVWPVMYSDVTDAWRLSRKQRIIVDLGGVYIQMIFTCFIVLAYYFTGDVAYIYMSFSIAILTLVNLSPFLRYDGYWALSDVMQISNLKDKAQFAVNNFFRWCIRFDNKWKNTKRQRFLLIYGLSRSAILILFLVYVLLYRTDSILLFPANFIDSAKVLFTDFGSVDFQWVKSKFFLFFLPTLFCIIATRELIKVFKVKLNK